MVNFTWRGEKMHNKTQLGIEYDIQLLIGDTGGLNKGQYSDFNIRQNKTTVKMRKCILHTWMYITHIWNFDYIKKDVINKQS